MRSCILFLLITVLLSLCNTVDSRGVWGSRRKVIEEEEAAAASQQYAEVDVQSLHSAQRRGMAGRNRGVGAGFEEKVAEMASKVSGLVDTYIVMMEEFMESPAFDSALTRENIDSMMANIPMLEQNPELRAVFDNLDLSDLPQLKATISTGLRGLSEVLKDPQMVMGMMEQIPSEMRPVLDGIVNGDMSLLKSYIDALPGLQEEHRRLISDALDGNTESLVRRVTDMLNLGPEQIESVRQNLLAEASVASMMGIPEDTLNDEAKFAELMAKGMESLQGLAAGAEAAVEQEENPGASRRFAFSK